MPEKSKGMRWMTYQRQLAKLNSVHNAVDRAILARFGPLLVKDFT